VGTFGLGITDGSDVTAFDSLFNINGEESRGILFTNSKKVNVFENLFDFATRPPVVGDEFNAGIYLNGSDEGLQIINNRFLGPTDLNRVSDAAADGTKGIFIKKSDADDSTTSEIANNTFSGLENGIVIACASGVKLEDNCLAYNNVAIKFGSGVTGIKMDDNDFINNEVGVIEPDNTMVIYPTLNQSSNEINKILGHKV